MKKFFLFLTLLTLSVGQMWGDTYTLGWGTASGTTGTYSNFTAISGSVTNIVSFSSDKNSSSNTPAYNSSSSELRLYYASNGSGGSVTLTPATGVTITGFVMTTSTSPSVKYSVNGGSATSVSVNNNTYTVTGISASTSLKIQNVNTTNTQLRIKTIAITYTIASSKTLSSIAVKTAPTKVKYVAGENFDPSGLKITATYSDASKEDISYAAATFTLSPTTSTALTTSNTSVSITYGGKSTSQAINVYNVTMQARDEDGNAIPAGGPGAPSRTGKSISPANDANNYVFKQWQVTNASLGSGESTKSNTITNPTGAVTVTAVYYKPITITYKANGETFTTQTYGYGGTLAFPASGPDGATYSCTGKTFVGWVGEANKNYSHASTAPTYATAGGSVTEAATYYAVFATASTGSGSTTLLSEDFSDCDSGDNTTTGGSGSAWSGNDNIPTVNTAYKAGEAVKLGGKSATGYFVTKQLTAAIGDQITIAFKVKGWSSVEGNIQVSGNNSEFTQPSATTYSATMSGSFESKSVTVTLTKANPYIKIATTAKRAFIDDLVITKTGGTTYSNFETNCCTPLGSINGSFFGPTFFSYLAC